MTKTTHRSPAVRSRLFAAMILAAALFAGPCAAQPAEVYLLGGQSNMRSGIQTAFVAEMLALDSDRTIYSYRYQNGGRGLDSGWNNQAWLGDPPGPGRSTFYPGLLPGDANVGTAYSAMLSQFQSGLTSLNNQNIDYEIKGLVWVHGEQDTKNQVSAERYANNLAHLSDRIHEDLGLAGNALPFVYSKLLSTAAHFPFADEVRQQQMNADADSSHADAIANAQLVETAGLTFSDGVHYTAASQTELGHRLAAEMHRAVQIPEPATLLFTTLGLVIAMGPAGRRSTRGRR